ncbi:hypothetical protein ACS0TY_017562 [Phlomoides rotata]
MKKCELCKAKARMHCESDQASLCWDCDAKVHSANFLVARHSRNLLCHVCQSPTPWSASGGKLGPTVSICEQCVDRGICDDSGEEESEEEEVIVEVVEENQVVPWSPPPPTESSSSVEESVSDEDVVVSRKRFRIDYESEEDQSYTSSYRDICNPPPSDSAVEASPRKKFQSIESGRVEVCETGILDSPRRFHREETGPGEKMTELSASPGPSI